MKNTVSLYEIEAQGIPLVLGGYPRNMAGCTSSSSTTTPTLLRLLCIHGYRQNEQMFRERTGALRKVLKKKAELVFISAPNLVPPSEDLQDGEPAPDQRGWWFSREGSFFNAHDSTARSDGYEESLVVVRKAFEEKGPFDGVLGFSQGASLVSLLCAIHESEKDDQKDSSMKFDFAILIAAFKSRSSCHDDLYKRVVTMPTLHVFGDTDKVIPCEMSVDLLPCYRQPVILRHPGGHFIPTSSAQKAVYIEFLHDMLQRRHPVAADVNQT